ncbi:(Fe-S)-binding protein [Vampirovibrio chlorellavorus]|uniref:(Fe-S)-binding protein n=1 Tax=Vampirovibrio chlorellavorus TaxID=758823 RepID=UPI0026F228E9|nr:(Fe-S)-binding protein [Vampirovibrio chlorellavorus]
MSHTPLPHLQLELDKLKACIHCGICLPACPTYQATGSEAESPRGRLYLMKKLLEGQLEPEAVKPHLDQCLACHGCETVCPSAVQYGNILLSTREDLAQRDPSLSRRLKRFIFRRVLPNHRLLVWGGRFLRIYQRSGLQWLVRVLGLLKIAPTLAHQEGLLPDIPARKALTPGMGFGDSTGETVALLTGCVMDIFYNPVHWDTIEALAANGYWVVIPEQDCCGALAHHAGETDITRERAKDLITKTLRIQPRWIVVNSAGCGSTMKDYGKLLAGDSSIAPQAAEFSEKLIDVMALLAQKPLAPFKNYGLHEKITYHAACHLYHVQKVKQEPLDLLAQVPGVELVPLTNMEACCGSAGIFNLEHPELSGEILQEKMAHLSAACQTNGASTVVTGNPGCMLQLQKGIEAQHLPMQVRHPISVLAEAYRSPQPGRTNRPGTQGKPRQ